MAGALGRPRRQDRVSLERVQEAKREQHSHPHESATLWGPRAQEVPVQASQDTVSAAGSRQQERPRETLIYNGIWAQCCLLQELSSQDIPKKPLERWGGKFLEVFG